METFDFHCVFGLFFILYSLCCYTVHHQGRTYLTGIPFMVALDSYLALHSLALAREIIHYYVHRYESFFF